ncbi:unnamed protein product [Mytilus coruscus]|uniref:Uncharacterized protein n=1 Tax=Mytilus coruscus TaxID=42192 RepID=A0A6J8CKL7_MYTCO|nr:unnamed protein product [Mytilus coruscus]
MEVVEEVADGDALLELVEPDNHDFVREIFLNDDSGDEFLGFDEDDLENDEQIAPFEDTWIRGNLDTRALPFDKEKSLNFDVGDNPEMVDFLRLILDDVFFDTLVEETNRYATDFFATPDGQNLKPHSRFKQWEDVNRDDMSRFIGMIIAMGLVQQQDLHDYWSKDELLETPFFRKIMPRNKFLLMLSFLHLNNNHINIPRGQPGHDPIAKIRPVYDHLRSNFQELYYPGENIAIDEGMVAWRGNLSFRVYMPDKPNKFGVKLFMLCDSSNGYCSRLEIYYATDQNPSPKEKIYDLVMRLMQPYLNKGHKLYVDNYYTSPILFHDLRQLGTGACGTLRSNRKGVPDDIKNVKLKKGESVAMTNGILQILKWKDKRDVHKEGLKSKPLRTCPVCNVPTGKRKTAGDGRKVVRSSYECKDCDVGLCVDPCFRLYHTYKDFKTTHRRLTRPQENDSESDSD